MSSKRIIEQLERVGVRARFTGLNHLGSVQDEILNLLHDGSLDRALFEEYLAGYDYQVPGSFPEARSVVIAAIPSLPIKVVLHHDGEVFDTLVPPTYADAKEVDERFLAAMKRLSTPSARFSRIFLPLKTLASHTGVVLYGRNNIGYVPELGSFHRLTAFLTNIEVEDDPWGEKGVLPACRTCRKCLEACPNQVISEDRFLVRAKRCLTYQNEQPSERPFPEWVRGDAHNALIGCMICQRVCPYYSDVTGQLGEGQVFSEEETELLLREDHQGPSRTEVERKLAILGLDLSIFPRNLEVLLR